MLIRNSGEDSKFWGGLDKVKQNFKIIIDYIRYSMFWSRLFWRLYKIPRLIEQLLLRYGSEVWITVGWVQYQALLHNVIVTNSEYKWSGVSVKCPSQPIFAFLYKAKKGCLSRLDSQCFKKELCEPNTIKLTLNFEYLT